MKNVNFRNVLNLLLVGIMAILVVIVELTVYICSRVDIWLGGDWLSVNQFLAIFCFVNLALTGLCTFYLRRRRLGDLFAQLLDVVRVITVLSGLIPFIAIVANIINEHYLNLMLVWGFVFGLVMVLFVAAYTSWAKKDKQDGHQSHLV